MRQYRTGLWQNSDFVKLWFGQTVSYFGSGITSIALPLTAVLILAATPVQMGILGALDGVSVLVIGLLAGGSVTFALILLFLSQLLGDASVSIYFIPDVSLRQSLVPSNLLGRTNASMQFLSQGVASLGALLAGILGGTIGLRLTILIGVLGIMLAGTLLLLSPARKV